jgi:predicted LPLAT superfamily acyltransferase
MSHDWTQDKERGTEFFLLLIRWIAVHLGRPVARLLLFPITAYFFLFAPDARRASYRFLHRIQGSPAHWWQVARHLHHFSATILDRVFLLTGKHGQLDITVHNAELVFEHTTPGNCAVLLGSHLGSFEVLRALAINDRKLRLKVLMHEAHNELITRILHALNPDVAETVIPLGTPNSLLKAYEYLQQGYLIGMLGDRVVDSAKTTACDFLGSQTDFPTGPMLTAAALKAPVILFFGLYQGGRRYEIHFELLANQVTIDRSRRAQDVQLWTQRYADRLAHFTRMSPYNWFNFYDFWETDS